MRYAGPTMSHGLSAAIRTRIERRLRRLALPVRVVLPDGSPLDLGPAPQIVLALRRRAVVFMLLRGDVDALGRAYVEGDLVVEGRIEDVIDIGIALAERLKRMGWALRLPALVPQLRRRHTAAADASWISYHYDVSDAFYALWLDRRMIYSCAYFETGAEDIDAAQEQKLAHICRKLRLRPGERLLDVGCGWGGLLAFAAEHYGVTGVGITISGNQYEFARRRIAEQGLSDRVELRLEDYRALKGEASFDKIVSVGMYEHVGHDNRPLYFATLARLLKANGLLLNHGITATDPGGGRSGPPGGGFIDRFVFPGGELPHIARAIGEMAAQGLDVLDVENLRPHYAATLSHWVKRLEAQQGAAIEAAGEARFRIWRVYMAGCAIAFARNWLSIYQVLAGKCGKDGALTRPWTRRHQYVADDPAVISRAHWGGA